MQITKCTLIIVLLSISSCSSHLSPNIYGVWRHLDLEYETGIQYVEIKIDKDSIESTGFHNMFRSQTSKYEYRNDSILVFNQELLFKRVSDTELSSEYLGRTVLFQKLPGIKDSKNAGIRFVKLLAKRDLQNGQVLDPILKDFLWKSTIPEIDINLFKNVETSVIDTFEVDDN